MNRRTIELSCGHHPLFNNPAPRKKDVIWCVSCEAYATVTKTTGLGWVGICQCGYRTWTSSPTKREAIERLGRHCKTKGHSPKLIRRAFELAKEAAS